MRLGGSITSVDVSEKGYISSCCRDSNPRSSGLYTALSPCNYAFPARTCVGYRMSNICVCLLPPYRYRSSKYSNVQIRFPVQDKCTERHARARRTLLHILEILGSNLGLEIHCPDWSLLQFFLANSANKDNISIRPLPFYSTSLLFSNQRAFVSAR